MIYDKKSLLTTAKNVKADIEKAEAETRRRAEAKYAEGVANWTTKGKQQVLGFLAQAARDTRANKPVSWPSGYSSRSLPAPPSKPEAATCNTQVVSLVALIEMLNTLADDTITPNALSASGFKDVSRLLRRPCR